MTHDIAALAGIVGFLVAMMVLARACADEGLFEAVGARLDRVADGSSTRLLALSVALAAAVTIVLSLDATVVLLTPVLLAASARPYASTAFASMRLANSASTLLPVSNLTNLLAFSATGLSFLAFAGAMLPVCLVAVLLELVALRIWFRRELRRPYVAPHGAPDDVPLFPAAVVLVVLLGLASGLEPWAVGVAGAVILGGYALGRRSSTWRGLLDAANLPMAAFVLVWAFAVAWLGTTPVGTWFESLLPHSTTLPALLGTALAAMLAANVVNNLPATLLLLPAAESAGSAAVLAMLIGVNVGANLTLVGSLANVLWRQTPARGVTTLKQLHLLGIATTPFIVVACTVVLWATV